MAVAIDHDLVERTFIRDAVPNPVVEPVAGTDVVMLARDQITEDVGAGVVSESEVPVKHLPGGGRSPVSCVPSSKCAVTLPASGS